MSVLFRAIVAAAVLALAGAGSTACAPGKRLPVSPITQTEISGTVTLYLYGCRYPADVKNAAFLIREEAGYTFDIFDLATSYTTKRGVPAAQALREAQAFLQCTNRRVTSTALRRVSDDTGGILGYEMRPLYFPLEFGVPDILLISYVLRDRVVSAYIEYQPGVENTIENVGPDNRDSSRD